jgi:excisionase family DNA binding protein
MGAGRELIVEARDRLLTPGEVASLFRVDPKTVTRWAAAGRINSIRTPGGHRRFRESEIRDLLRQDTSKAMPAAAVAPAPRGAGDDQPAPA